MGVTLRPDKSSLVTGIKVNPGVNAG